MDEISVTLKLVGMEQRPIITVTLPGMTRKVTGVLNIDELAELLGQLSQADIDIMQATR